MKQEEYIKSNKNLMYKMKIIMTEREKDVEENAPSFGRSDT